MAIHAEQLTRWTADAERDLATARATAADLIEWRESVSQGTAQLWRLTGDSISHLLTRVETYRDGSRELVLVAGAGKNARAAIAWVTQLADRHGLPLRAHITRPGLRRIFQNNGWHQSEIIMRRGNGQ